MAVKETDLPGIGRRYELDTGSRGRVVVIVHHTGQRDLYLWEKRENSPHCELQMDDDDARRLGAILSGSYFRPSLPDGIEAVMGHLAIDWATVDRSSPLAGKTILDAQIRTRTGMTVIGIVRGGSAVTSIDPATEIQAGDRIVVVGPLDRMGDFVDLVKG